MSRVTLGITGVRNERLRLEEFSTLDAIVGRLPAPPRPTTAALRRYDAVIRRIAARYPAVLPARFGTCVSDLDELESVIRSRQTSLRAALRLVRNRVQMTVRVFRPGGTAAHPDEGPPKAQVRSGLPAAITPAGGGPSSRHRLVESQSNAFLAEGGPGRRYLRARVALMSAHDIPELEPLRPAVKRWVRAEVVARHGGGKLIASLYHLIPRGATAQYQRALERAAHAVDMTTVVSGPWPPYAFTDDLPY